MFTVSIPDDIDKQLSTLTSNKEEFIITAIRQKIALRNKVISDEELAKEYADSASENKAITEDFTYTDGEDSQNW